MRAAYRVGELARLAHISVRALHHYDEIGLLHPSARSEAGYRLYTASDLERLQQILFYRGIGLSLNSIRTIVTNPGFDRRAALLDLRTQVAGRAARLESMLRLIDATLLSLDGGITMSDDELFEVFGEFDPRQYEDEVKERWGHTEAYSESMRRTRGYSRRDWEELKAEGGEVELQLAELLEAGVPADDERAMDEAERHRLMIDRRFYPCSHEMHAALGQMYLSDPRFRSHYEAVRPGLAAYVRDAILANRGRTAR